jgi:glycosyltransferase involved in cell wall biosynthesis
VFERFRAGVARRIIVSGRAFVADKPALRAAVRAVWRKARTRGYRITTAFYGPELVLPLSTGAGGPPLLPAPGRPRALFIDSRLPRSDRDSGSLDAMVQVHALLGFGYEVVFAGDSDFAEASPYRTRLEAEGVICLSSALCRSVQVFLQRDGASLDLCVLSRVTSGGRYLEAVRHHAPRAQVVFNTVDLHHIREEREARLRGDVMALHAAALMRERELYLVRQADATIVVSATERAILEADVPGAAVFEMPLVRPVRAVDRVPPFDARNGIGFVGGFDHAPNVDAIRYLLGDIWPRVLARLPSAELSIVGMDLPAKLSAQLPHGVRYLGAIPEIDPWLDKLRLTVAPLRYGAGAKGKVASSLAACVPCVATRIAAEGMRLENGLHIAVGDSEEMLAALICEVHEDPILWQRLATGGHERARQEHGLAAGERRLATLLRALNLPVPDGPANERDDRRADRT